MKKTAMIVAFLAGSTAAAETVVGDLARLSVTNGVLSDVLVSAPLAHPIDKIGDGNYSIPVERVRARSEVGANVHQGTLSFSDSGGAIPSVTAPPAVLDTAAFWLEAGTKQLLPSRFWGRR